MLPGDIHPFGRQQDPYHGHTKLGTYLWWKITKDLWKDLFLMYLWSSGPLVQKYTFNSLESSDFYDLKI